MAKIRPATRLQAQSATTSGGSDPPTGLLFPLNSTPNSDIRIVFDGANFLPRVGHTVIWRKLYTPGQEGYDADTWHSPNTGSWDGGAYSFGVHGHPCTGTYDGAGERSVGTSNTGEVQYFEIAGCAGSGLAKDKIALPMEPAFVLNEPGNGSAPAQAGTWLTHARTCESISGGTQIRHRAWPDVENAPNDYIETTFDTGDLGSAGSDPAFYFGASDWIADIPSAGRNEETPGGVMRGLRLYDAVLSIAELSAEHLRIGTNTTAKPSDVWYINDNPTPTDVTDKSGAGHDPSWANANRPTLWEP